MVEPEPEPEQESPQAHSAENTTKQSFAKPLIYSSALAAVLVAMSLLVKDPSTIFGERASAKATLKQSALTPPNPVPGKSTPLAAGLYNGDVEADAGLVPAQVPLDTIRPLQGAISKGSGLGGPIGSIGRDGLPEVRVYPPRRIASSTRRDRPKHRTDNRTASKNSSKAPRQSRGIVVYDADGKVITTGQNNE